MLLPLVFRTMRNSVILHNIRPEMEVGPCACTHAVQWAHLGRPNSTGSPVWTRDTAPPP